MSAADAAERARRSRCAQGLPERIEDAQALAAVAAVLAPQGRPEREVAAA